MGLFGRYLCCQQGLHRLLTFCRPYGAIRSSLFLSAGVYTACLFCCRPYGASLKIHALYSVLALISRKAAAASSSVL